MTPKTIFGNASIKKTDEPSSTKVTPSVLFSGNVITKTEKVSKSEPSQIFGKTAIVRNRIKVSVVDLKDKYPKINDAVLNKAVELILTTNCEQINQTDIINWGYSAQEKYTDLVENIANINGSVLLSATKQLINEIGELIELDTKTNGIIKKLFNKNNTEAIYRKIVVKNELLKKNTIMLHNLLEVIKNCMQNTIALEHEILVNVIAGNFIMDFIPNQYKDTFTSRIISLESLNTQFKLSKKQLELLDETIIKMISIIQDTLSVEVPTWYNNKTFVNISENKKQEILNKIKL
jgi:hypothetical protein